MTRVLVVDGSPHILATLRLNLRARHYEVAEAPTGEQALRRAADWHPDLVILDLGLPDLDGIAMIRGLRDRSRVPIIVLSEQSGSGDMVGALDAGADDYVTKPFGMEVLLARIRAITRRAPAGGDSFGLRIGDFVVDLDARTVQGEDGPAPHLTPTEWAILERLVRDPGKLVTPRQLLADVWGPEHIGESHHLRVYLSGLRRKLERDPSRPRHLITEPGMGYRFDP